MMSDSASDQQGSTEGFTRITIVGLGLIGGSLAVALRRAGFRGELVGVSRDTTLREALRQGAIDRGCGYGELTTACSGSQLVVLATPIDRIVAHIEELGRAGDRALEDGTIVTDVGSTKGRILEAAEAHLPRGVHFIGGHPMAGSEHRGFAAADPFLFQNAIYALTPRSGVPPAAIDRLGELLGELGARVVVLEAALHDHLAATISHLPQLLAVALVNSLDELGEHRDLAVRFAAGGFRDMTRIAASPFDIWRDIYGTNREAVREAARRFRNQLEALDALVGDDGLGGRFDAAAATRSQIPLDTKGFLRPLFALLVVVEDRPGIIAEISTALADAGINIKDIEVLKMRENEGGTLRLAFASRAEAEGAADILTQRGFTARLRD